FIEATRVVEIAPIWLAYVWVLTCGTAGALIAFGLWLQNPRLEQPGLLLLGAVLAVQVYSVLSVAADRAVFGACIQGSLMIGLFVRAFFLDDIEGRMAQLARDL